MSNVFSLATGKPITSAPKTRTRRKAAPAAAPAPNPEREFCRVDDLEPHLLEPGDERGQALYVALAIAMSEINPSPYMPRRPLAALRKARRAVAILEIECAELDRAALKGGAQ